MRTLAFAAAATVGLTAACAHVGVRQAKPSERGHLSQQARVEVIRRARVWAQTDIARMDVRRGPVAKDGFSPQQTVTCEYREERLSGRSPKFSCALTPTDHVKVKYGAENGEVAAEVAATRLFWALGFPADRMYPVRVVCRGCPADPHAGNGNKRPQVIFDPASIERKMEGTALEVHADSGWAWPELDLVDESAGGAPLAQRDALKLLAVFVQHTDNKAAQQRLICLHRERHDARDVCTEPVMMVNDLGLTFGRANLFNRNSVGSANFDGWTGAKVWSDPARCIGNLPISQTGSLDNPRISEAGRKFLADLLNQLTDDQLRDLFEVARFAERKGTKHAATVDEWVDVFKRKRAEISDHTCPS